jgi:hypothetical protein
VSDGARAQVEQAIEALLAAAVEAKRLFIAGDVAGMVLAARAAGVAADAVADLLAGSRP